MTITERASTLPTDEMRRRFDDRAKRDDRDSQFFGKIADRDRRTREYADVTVLRRLVRRTAATRPMTWLCVRVQQRLDRLVCELTRGRTTLSSLLSGLPVVMLTTTGAKTGQPRTLPVLGFPDGDGLVVIASNYGRPHHPAWYHNLRAYPRALLVVNGVARELEAHELAGHERDRCFHAATRMHPGFRLYQQRASNRPIPVLRLERTRAADPAHDEVGHIWRTRSCHQTSEGAVSYQQCRCGRWRILLDR